MRLQSAQADEAEARADSFRNPPDKADKVTFQQTDQGLMRIDSTTGEATPVMFNGQPLAPKTPPVRGEITDVKVDGKEHQQLINPETGDLIRDLGEKGEKPVREPQAPGVTLVVPGPDGTQHVERLTAGQPVPTGAVTPQQFGQASTPTQQMRTAGVRANLAAQEIPGIVQEVNSLRDQLGMVSGRWSEFMQGKVGMDNPQIAGLRSDLIFLSSAVALAHAVGRLPENLRQEFDRMINATKQSPDNLITTLQHVQKWMNDNASAMTNMRPGQGGSNTPPPGAKVVKFEDVK